MRTKKILSAALAMSMAASAMLSSGAFQASAADSKLTFDIRSGGKNEIHISAADIAAGDYTVPVDIYIPENPGVNAIQLKLQVNDGEEQEDGSLKNYGLYMSDAALASPYCFDSANKGDAEAAFAGNFKASKMNLTWVYSDQPDVNADAAKEANTTKWSADAAWAYENAFATANLVVPKDTPAGTYKLDIRRDKFVNSLASEQYGMSACSAAGSDTAVSYDSVPLSVVVDAVSTEAAWVDSYKIKDGGHYYIIGDVCGAPGETVDVPVYIFGDKGTAGIQVFFGYDSELKLNKFVQSKDNYAYRLDAQKNVDVVPASYVLATKENLVAKDGAILTMLNFTIPETAKEGTCYDITFMEDKESIIKVVDYDSNFLDVDLYSGSITVLPTGKTALNRTSINFSQKGDTSNLTLFNAEGDVTWTSSDPAVATVDENGFVVAVGEGEATITASNGGKEYKATVKFGGMFGDVDGDGQVTNMDAQLTLIHATEVMTGNSGTLTDAQAAIADVNSDGKVDSADAQYILIYYVEKVVSGNTNTTWYDVTKNDKAPKDY